jgi:hypothetical protein
MHAPRITKSNVGVSGHLNVVSECWQTLVVIESVNFDLEFLEDRSLINPGESCILCVNSPKQDCCSPCSK